MLSFLIFTKIPPRNAALDNIGNNNFTADEKYEAIQTKLKLTDPYIRMTLKCGKLNRILSLNAFE